MVDTAELSQCCFIPASGSIFQTGDIAIHYIGTVGKLNSRFELGAKLMLYAKNKKGQAIRRWTAFSN